jgi:hypothetical protein
MNLSSTPNLGALSVAKAVAAAPSSSGALVTVSGTYLNHEGAVYDDSSIVTSMVPGPIAGAPALKVDGLPKGFIDALTPDAVAGTDERWGPVRLTGTLDAAGGVATLHVRDALLKAPNSTIGPDPHDFGGTIPDPADAPPRDGLAAFGGFIDG